MENPEWQQVWLASDAARTAANYEAAGETVPAQLEQQLTDNLPAVDTAYAELRPRLDNLPDQPAADNALYDSLLTSPEGETAASICWRAIARVRGEPEPAPKLAQTEVIEPIYAAQPEQADDEWPPDNPELFARVRSEDETVRRQAQTELVERYGRFAHLKAWQFYRKMPKQPGVDYNDFALEGIFGIFRAAERYKYGRGADFLIYARYWIESKISRHYSNMRSAVRIPVRRQPAVTKAVTLNDYQWVRHSSPPVDKIAETTGAEPSLRLEWDSTKHLTVGNLLAADALANHMKPLDEHLRSAESDRDGGYVPLGEVETLTSLTDMNPPIDVEEKAMRSALRTDLETAIESFVAPERNRHMLRMRFGLTVDGQCHTLQKCAEEFGVTKQRAHQIESAALKKLRASAEVRNLLKPYLEES